MDEVEKYQQRLQAITEKRRLQEEQDRAKRQQEDEKLRLQQLKRKSLRDQWLMEGPPLSPDSAGPRSPLWGQQPQKAEAYFNKLQSEIVEKTHMHKEDSSTSAQAHADHHGNGERTSAVTPPPSEEKSTDPAHGTSLTNGTAQDKKCNNGHSQHDNDISTGAETLLFLGYTEAEPGQGLCDDDDDISAVIRAERVIITEEGEEAKEDFQDTQAMAEEVGVEEREEEREEEVAEREKGQEEKGQEDREEERQEEREAEREKGQEEKGQEDREEKEKERQEEREEEKEEEREEERKDDREKEQENERVEKREEELADVENHLILITEVTELEEVLGHEKGELKPDFLNDTMVKTIKQTNEETSVNTDADVETNAVKEFISALNTDLTPDADLDVAVSEQKGAVAATHTQFLSETSGGAVQTPAASSPLPSSALNPNGAQKSAELASSFTNTLAPFQEIPLDGGVVEEEPLLATRVEPLTDASNLKQAERAKTKTCQCCSVM